MAADRIAIFGAGSVGCFIGGCWQAAGLPVTFVGRPRIAHAIHQHGLTLTDYTGWSWASHEIEFSSVPAPLADADIIVLCVKSDATTEAAAQIADNARPGALVVSFQNGISNLDTLKRELRDRFQVVRGIVQFNVANLGEGRFHKGVAGSLYAEDRQELRALADCVRSGPASLELHQDMLGIAWGKLLINLNNAVNALSGRTLLDELNERGYRRVVAASQREGLRLVKRAGIKPAKIAAVAPRLLPVVIGSPNWMFRNIFLRSWKIDEKARSSMNDDLAAGRVTEVDYINGELVALAERLGTDAPINRKIVELVRRAEAGEQRWSPEALNREVLGR